MILIADSGSTKTDWVLIGNGAVKHRMQGNGLNPSIQSEEYIRQELKIVLGPLTADIEVEKIYFYGAGCTPAKAGIMRQLLAEAVPQAENIAVESDMLAACRSVCADSPGIVCILGTGSNSCFYDGRRMVKNVPSLGYILGDEGSGNMMGRTLLSDLLKGLLDKDLEEAFYAAYQTDAADIIEAVYRRPNANRYLASFAPFIKDHIAHPQMRQLVQQGFETFVSRNVMQYDHDAYPVHFIGGIAWTFREILHETLTDMHIKTGLVRQSPIEGLLEYHLRKG